MITEYNVASSVIGTIQAGLTQLEMTNWSIIQGAQSVVHPLARPTFVLTFISNNRYGWQHSKDTYANGKFIHKEFIYQTINFQLTAFKLDRNNQESAMDASVKLAMFLNSEAAINSLQAQGLGISRIGEIRGGIWINDSDRYEQSPSFDFDISLRQELASYVEPASSIEGIIKGV